MPHADPAQRRAYNKTYWAALKADPVRLAQSAKLSSARGKQYRKRHPERLRLVDQASGRRRRAKPDHYPWRSLLEGCARMGITLDQYAATDEAQDWVCAICHREPTTERLHIDHDHRTGKFRGLLCGNCNRGIGLFADNAEYLQQAIQYVSGPSTRPK